MNLMPEIEHEEYFKMVTTGYSSPKFKLAMWLNNAQSAAKVNITTKAQIALN